MGKFRSITGDPPRRQTDAVCITHQGGGPYYALVSDGDDETILGSFPSLLEAVGCCADYLLTTMKEQLGER